MMECGAYADPQAVAAKTRELKQRVLSVLRAGTYQMDRFLALVVLTPSDEVATAAVRTGPQPVMLLNPQFVDEFCRRDEHLLMLILHELYHIILGHSRLFERTTVEQNIAFDSIINSMLCQQFREPVYLEFFRNLNPDLELPSRLLRPPSAWPDRLVTEPCGSRKVRSLMKRLYGPDSAQVTVEDVLSVLPSAPDREDAGAEGGSHQTGSAPHILLGDHEAPGGDGGFEAKARDDAVVRAALRDTIKNWPFDAQDGLRGRGLGGDPSSFLMPRVPSARPSFLQALRHLLGEAGILHSTKSKSYRWAQGQRFDSMETVVPMARDRRAAGWEEVFGEAPILFRSEVLRESRLWQSAHHAHVYLDISGSMSHEIAWISQALHCLDQKGACRIFVFSTVVDTVKHGKLLTQKVENTYGTDINCVYEHVLSLPADQRPSKIVVVTDGFTGRLSEEHAQGARKMGVALYVGLTPGGSAMWLSNEAKLIRSLPSPVG